MQRGSARHDDKKSDYNGADRADDHVPDNEFIVGDLDPFFDHRRLHVKLHPRRDGRAHQPQDHPKVIFVPLHGRFTEGFSNIGPVRFRQDRRNYVRKQENAEEQEYPFGGLVIALDNYKPYGYRRDGDRNIFADAEHHHAPRHAGKLRGRVSDVRDEKADENIEGYFDAEIFPDEVGKPFTGDDPHPRVHFLYCQERDKRRYEGPQQLIAVRGARHRIGRDAAGVVINAPGHDPRPEHAEKNQEVPEVNVFLDDLDNVHGLRSPGREIR